VTQDPLRTRGQKDGAAQQGVVDSQNAGGIDMPKTEIDGVEGGGNFQSLPVGMVRDDA